MSEEDEVIVFWNKASGQRWMLILYRHLIVSGWWLNCLLSLSQRTDSGPLPLWWVLLLIALLYRVMRHCIHRSISIQWWFTECSKITYDRDSLLLNVVDNCVSFNSNKSYMSKSAHVLLYTAAVWSQAGVPTPDTVSHQIHMVFFQFAKIKIFVNKQFN